MISIPKDEHKLVAVVLAIRYTLEYCWTQGFPFNLWAGPASFKLACRSSFEYQDSTNIME